jgi:hypothetical protein
MVALLEPVVVMLAVLVIAVLLLLAGTVAGVVVVLRAGVRHGGRETTTGPQLCAEVRAGEEQVLLQLMRRLPVAPERDEVAYGQIYVASSTNQVLRLGSRSEIGRGFAGEIRVRRDHDHSRVEYFRLALPGDETVRSDLDVLERQIVLALKELDPTARVDRRALPPAA